MLTRRRSLGPNAPIRGLLGGRSGEFRVRRMIPGANGFRMRVPGSSKLEFGGGSGADHG